MKMTNDTISGINAERDFSTQLGQKQVMSQGYKFDSKDQLSKSIDLSTSGHRNIDMNG